MKYLQLPGQLEDHYLPPSPQVASPGESLYVTTVGMIPHLSGFAFVVSNIFFHAVTRNPEPPFRFLASFVS